MPKPLPPLIACGEKIDAVEADRLESLQNQLDADFRHCMKIAVNTRLADIMLVTDMKIDDIQAFQQRMSELLETLEAADDGALD